MCLPLILIAAVCLVFATLRRKLKYDSDSVRLDQKTRGEKSHVDYGF